MSFWFSFHCRPAGHTCVEVRGALYVCGGCNDSSNMKPAEGGAELSDVWRLDLTAPHAELAWQRVSPPGSAPPAAQLVEYAVFPV